VVQLWVTMMRPVNSKVEVEVRKQPSHEVVANDSTCSLQRVEAARAKVFRHFPNGIAVAGQQEGQDEDKSFCMEYLPARCQQPDANSGGQRPCDGDHQIFFLHCTL